MPAQHIARFVHKIPGWVFPAGIAPDKALVIPVRHEADILAVPLAGRYKAPRLRRGSHLLLRKGPERESDMRKLLLRQHIQHIALVLGCIEARFQEPPPVVPPLRPCVMAGGYGAAAQLAGPADHIGKLHVPVALDAGIRRTARLVCPHKMADDILLENRRCIEHVMGHTQAARRRRGVLRIVCGAAHALPREADGIIAEHPQGHAHAFTAAVHQKERSYAAVHPAGHSDHDLFSQNARLLSIKYYTAALLYARS